MNKYQQMHEALDAAEGDLQAHSGESKVALITALALVDIAASLARIAATLTDITDPIGHSINVDLGR